MKGLGIQIKKKNKGTYTQFCKGLGYKSVTEECIAQGKASKNPKTRKRANFADVAKEWN